MRHANWAKFVLLVLLIVIGTTGWSKESNGVIHPIQRLLTSYSPSVPPETEIKLAGKTKGALEATFALLEARSNRQLWPTAVIALGVLGSPADTVLVETLITFQESGRPFGCLQESAEPRCTMECEDPGTRRLADGSRLNIPLALGYLLRQTTAQLRSNTKHHPVPSDRILEKLSEMTEDSYGEKVAIWNCSSSQSENEIHALELQLNAVRALSFSGRPEAKNLLLNISSASKNPLVRQEAKYSIEAWRGVAPE
jgi:hypothetical protein